MSNHLVRYLELLDPCDKMIRGLDNKHLIDGRWKELADKMAYCFDRMNEQEQMVAMEHQRRLYESHLQ